jgi:hypothetical protein
MWEINIFEFFYSSSCVRVNKLHITYKLEFFFSFKWIHTEIFMKCFFTIVVQRSYVYIEYPPYKTFCNQNLIFIISRISRIADADLF